MPNDIVISDSEDDRASNQGSKEVIRKDITHRGIHTNRRLLQKPSQFNEQAKRRMMAEKKAAKKKAADMYKPGECMKYMNIEAHPDLWSRWYMADVGREAAAAGAHIVQTPTICDPSLIMWSRNMPRTIDADAGQVRLTPAVSDCRSRALYIASADELCELVSAHALADRVQRLRDLCGCPVTLGVFQLKDYFKSSGRKTVNSNRFSMTEIDWEMAVADLLITAECDTVAVNTPNELALLIVQFTKAMAEAPYKTEKRLLDDQCRFYMRGDNKNCVAVDKDGNGLSRLWQQMITVLPQSSLETARAVCDHYKTPLALFKELQSPNSMEAMLNVQVSRSTAPGAQLRPLAAPFAYKLHRLFDSNTADDLL